MKAKATIRKLSPLQRELAKHQRAVHSLERRMTRLVDWAGDIEAEGRALRVENANLRGVIAAKSGTRPAPVPGDVQMPEAESAGDFPDYDR